MAMKELFKPEKRRERAYRSYTEQEQGERPRGGMAARRLRRRRTAETMKSTAAAQTSRKTSQPVQLRAKPSAAD